MIRVLRDAAQRHRNREDGVEAVAMLIVLPFMFILLMGLVDVGWMIRTRMIAENLASDTARRVAADGGNYNPRTSTTGKEWDDQGFETLWENNRCALSSCLPGRKPTVNCTKITRTSGAVYNSNTVDNSGDLVTCSVYYPYKGYNSALLNSPIGLGIGSLLKDFTITQSARAETGTEG